MTWSGCPLCPSDIPPAIGGNPAPSRPGHPPLAPLRLLAPPYVFDEGAVFHAALLWFSYLCSGLGLICVVGG